MPIALLDHDVVGLYVAVDDADVVRRAEDAGELDRQAQGAEWLDLLRLPERGGEGHSFDDLHREIRLWIVTAVEQGRRAAVTDRGERPRLAAKPVLEVLHAGAASVVAVDEDEDEDDPVDAVDTVEVEPAEVAGESPQAAAAQQSRTRGRGEQGIVRL